MANEILLTDKVITAKEAVTHRFANGIIDDVELDDEWIDPDMVPAIPKLLSFDVTTIKHCQKEMIDTKDMKKIEAVTRREADQLVAKWLDPDFLPLMMSYMMSVKTKAKNKIKKRMDLVMWVF